MLIEFSVENFKCFAEKQTLDMRPDPDITSLDENLIHTGLMYKDNEEEQEKELLLLPSIAIYGANASGKSSLIQSLNLIAPQDRESRHNTNIPNTTFFNNAKSITFEIKEQVKKLNLTVNSKIFHCEASSFYMFRQAYNGMHFGQVEPTEYKDLHGVLLDGFSGDFPVIDSHYFRKYYFLDEILQQSKKHTNQTTGIFDLSDGTSLPIIETLKDDVKRKKLEILIKKADFNIETIYLRHLEEDVGKGFYSILFQLKDETKKLRYNDQSEGTKKFLLIMPTIVHVLETGAVLLADELEAHLHPDLCRAIIELFNNPETNPKGSQLIFTTHNQDFMAPNLMRPDQIYFVNKDQATGASELYRASDFEEFDWNSETLTVRKAYHYGLLGSSPRVKRLTGE
jgi:AAA15 family ATPase/GTPase